MARFGFSEVFKRDFPMGWLGTCSVQPIPTPKHTKARRPRGRKPARKGKREGPGLTPRTSAAPKGDSGRQAGCRGKARPGDKRGRGIARLGEKLGRGLGGGLVGRNLFVRAGGAVSEVASGVIRVGRAADRAGAALVAMAERGDLAGLHFCSTWTISRPRACCLPTAPPWT